MISRAQREGELVFYFGCSTPFPLAYFFANGRCSSAEAGSRLEGKES